MSTTTSENPFITDYESQFNEGASLIPEALLIDDRVEAEDESSEATVADMADETSEAAVSMLRQPWNIKFREEMDLGLCMQTDPEIFFPERGESNKVAKKICGRCEITELCLRAAVERTEPYGVYGGASVAERRPLTKMNGEELDQAIGRILMKLPGLQSRTAGAEPIPAEISSPKPRVTREEKEAAKQVYLESDLGAKHLRMIEEWFPRTGAGLSNVDRLMIAKSLLRKERTMQSLADLYRIKYHHVVYISRIARQRIARYSDSTQQEFVEAGIL